METEPVGTRQALAESDIVIQGGKVVKSRFGDGFFTIKDDCVVIGMRQVPTKKRRKLYKTHAEAVRTVASMCSAFASLTTMIVVVFK